MKKFLCAGLISALIFNVAVADYAVTETEVITAWESVDVVVENDIAPRRFYSSRDVVRPCVRQAAQPVRVKTHTEVIDHYQVYQPVTVYKPMGTQTERRVVPVKNCNKCF